MTDKIPNMSKMELYHFLTEIYQNPVHHLQKLKYYAKPHFDTYIGVLKIKSYDTYILTYNIEIECK